MDEDAKKARIDAGLYWVRPDGRFSGMRFMPLAESAAPDPDRYCPGASAWICEFGLLRVEPAGFATGFPGLAIKP